MSFLDQLRQTTPEVKTTAEAPPAPAPASTEADRPPVDPAGPLPPYPFAIHSRTLDAEVWIVPDSWRDSLDAPAYTHTEIKALARSKPNPEALRAVHAVKVSLDGEIL